MAFRARELRDDASLPEIRRQLNEIQKEIAADLLALRQPSPVTSLVLDAVYSANYGQIVRVAPPSAGQRLILPPVNLAVPNGRVVAIVEAATGALSVEAVDSTINGSTTVTYLAGVGTVEFLLTPTGWYAWSASLQTVPLTSLAAQAADTFVGNVTAGTAAPTAVGLSTLAGAGLTFGSHALAVGSSTSITVNADDIQRPALTGDVTASANSNALTIANDAVTNAKAANMAANTIKANATSSAADPADLAIAANAFAARVGGDLISHPLASLAGDSLDYAAGVIDYVGNSASIGLGSITGAQGVVDISTLACGGRVNADPSGNYSIAGFTAKAAGYWFIYHDNNTSGVVTGTFLNNNGNTTTSIRPPGAVDFATFTQGRACLFFYANSRWRMIAGAST